MPQSSNFSPLVRAAGLLLLFNIVAGAQSAPPFAVRSVPTGLRPMGIGAFETVSSSGPPTFFSAFTVIANSGDNSVSVYRVFQTPSPTQVLTGISSPYAIAVCGREILVSSPSDNSVTLMIASTSGSVSVVGKVPTGPQPHAVACSRTTNLSVVSNVGDSTLTVFDKSSLKALATIPGVPGSRALGGIAMLGDVAWVSGTEADVVTVVDSKNAKLLTTIPLPQPRGVRVCSLGGKTGICIASANAGQIVSIDPETFAFVPSRQYTPVPNVQDSSEEGTALSASPASLWAFGLMPYASIVGPIVNLPDAAGFQMAVNSNPSPPLPNERFALLTSPSNNSLVVVTLQPQQPMMAALNVSNAASFVQSSIAAGSLASVFVTTGVSQSAKASSLPLPTTLAGVSLKIGGTLSFIPSSGLSYSPSGSVAAPLLFVGPNQINFQVPTGIAPAPYVQAQLTLPDGSTQLSTLTIAATSPGIFAISQTGVGQGAILNQDFSQNGSPQVLPGSRPAARGEVIHIYATGCGETTPALTTGEPAPTSGNPLVVTKVQPEVSIGGFGARVLFGGMAPGFVGLCQIDAEVPRTIVPGSVVPVIVNIGGQTSNTVTIAVQ